MDRITSSFDSIASLPAGSVITKVYWTVRNQYGYVGDAHDSQHDVLVTAIEDRKRRNKNLNPGDYRPERIDIELRWSVDYPAGHRQAGSIDLAVHAVQYPTLADAVEHLALLKQWSV